MAEQRPDPDRVLAQIQAEAAAGRRGMLKVFFGYAAGVGKTYAMLEAARAQAAAGVDVVAGYVETHGRAETDALLEGLEILPRREVEYRGIHLREFDLDAALARKPAVLLVDELAHSNAPELRHSKRWQDVEELREAGIGVFTTVNVQHLESLNDVIAQITGVVVRETVPDTVLEGADRIELVDLPPDDLIQRLHEGKVYVADQARQAVDRFFQRSNLIALRELSLRRTAERVNEEVETARLSQAAPGTWPTSERLLVCVGPSPTSAKVVRAAKRLASALRADWIAASVETPATASLSARSRQLLEQNLSLAERLGAEVASLHGGSVAETIVEYARARNATKILIGKTVQRRWLPRLRASILDELVRLSGDVDIYVIRGVEGPSEGARPPAARRSAWVGYAKAATVMALCTLLAGLFHRTGLAEANVVMTLLLGVVLAAARYGPGPSIFASFAGVLLFNFFYVPPYGTFAVADLQYLITFAVMLVVGLIISALTARIRRQADMLQQRGLRAEALFHLTQELTSTSGIQQLAETAESHVREFLAAEAALFLPSGAAGLAPVTERGRRFGLDPREAAVAQWAFDHGRMAGAGTDTLPGAAALYLPLAGPHGTIGVLGLRQAQPSRLLAADPKQLLETFASQIALAVEREQLAEAAQKSMVQAEAERLRSSLLSSVSHDLRTPLATIAGASTALLEHAHDEETRRKLLTTISDEASRLGQFVENILQMTRLQSGSLTLHREWQPVEEVIGSALGRMQTALAERPVRTHVPDGLPMAPFDGVLIQEVLVNLLDNAAKYTPPGTPIEISATAENKQLNLEVADRGPGLPEEERQRIFEKFYRIRRPGEKTPPGTGLGLSICQAIVEAHGGHIWAENRPEGGARFCFALPIEGEPPTLPPEEPAPTRESFGM